jgi:UDP-N-acetylmuramate dehydrogenase
MYSIDHNHSLKNHNTFGLDVKADHFVHCTAEEDILSFLSDNPFPGKPMLILGAGSNILFVEDFNGVVIYPDIRDITLAGETGETAIIYAGAGVVWDEFVEWAVSRNYSGIENLSLIPGKVGAAPIQNIGAYGAEVGEVIRKVHYIDIHSRVKHAISGIDCEFSYRSSIFKTILKNKVIITRVEFQLSKKPELNTRYGKIEERLQAIRDPGIRDIRDLVIEIRNEKLPDPAKTGNAGSFFKNPVIDPDRFERLRQAHPAIPSYPSPDRHQIKIPAAWLIEQCGLKGIRSGNTGTWHKQPLVLVNHGRATGHEILAYSEKISQEAFERFGIRLVPEVNIMYSEGFR